MVTAIEVIINSTFIVSFDVALILVKNHASLENLDYEHSGHTGFASAADALLKLNKDNFGWVIADNTYNPTYSYNKGDTVYYIDQVSPYRGYLYVAKVDIPAPAGPFDYTKWETTTLERLIWYKQDKLTAGTGITIVDNVISASGGGGGLTKIQKIYSGQPFTEAEVTLLKNMEAYVAINYGGGSDTGTRFYLPFNNRYGVNKLVLTSIVSNDYIIELEINTSDYSWTETAKSLQGKTDPVAVVIETGALVKKLYNDIKDYKLIFCYGYRDALSAPNQFMFAFMPDQLQVNGEDLQFLAMAGPSNWEYPIRVKRNSDGYVYWWSAYDYGGNTTFFVTKIVGIRQYEN